MPLYVGIDPGQTGGIVALTLSGEVRFKSIMPVKDGLIDGRALAAIFRSVLQDAVVVLELAQSFPKQGVASSFNYGRGFGVIEGVLQSLRIDYKLVRPAWWTKVLHEGLLKELPPKVRSLQVAKRLFPNEDLRKNTRCKNFHEGLVDAALLAEYGRRKF